MDDKGDRQIASASFAKDASGHELVGVLIDLRKKGRQSQGRAVDQQRPSDTAVKGKMRAQALPPVEPDQGRRTPQPGHNRRAIDPQQPPAQRDRPGSQSDAEDDMRHFDQGGLLHGFSGQ